MLDYLRKLYDYLPSLALPEDASHEVSSAVSKCIADDKLMDAVEKYYKDFFVAEKEYGREISEITDSYTDSKLGAGMIFTVVIFLRAFILTSEKTFIYNKEAVNFFNPVIRHYLLNIKRNNSFGFMNVQRFWAYCYLRPTSFELGRLAFEIMDYNYGYEVWLDPKTGKSYPVALQGERFDENGLPDSEGSFCTTLSYDGETLTGYTYKNDGTLDFEIKTFKGYKCVLKGGDKVVAVHMPGNARLSEEAVSASLIGAKEFFDTYFNNLDYKAFVSSSWLLDTGLRKILKEDSNIVKLQKRFRIALAFKNNFSLFDNIFEVPRCPIEELIPKNRFQKEVLEMIKGGRSLYSGRGYILKEEVI